jgi:hypothetical protein
MLINLLPDFLAVMNSSDRTAAYLKYFDAHLEGWIGAQQLVRQGWHGPLWKVLLFGAGLCFVIFTMSGLVGSSLEESAHRINHRTPR